MEEKKGYDIFISYRRLDEHGNISGRDQARLIAKQLELEGYHPFFDYSEIKDNEFDKVIIPAVENCKVFILVLTKDALNRCKDENDWVRREIETAISSHCKLVNVTPDNSFNGWPNTLPKTLYSIRNIQISEINMGSLFELSIKKMINDRIKSSLHILSDRFNGQKGYMWKIIKYFKKTLNLIKILLLFVSVLIFFSFAVMDIGYDNKSFFVPYYEWFLGAYSIYMILALVGYVKPQILFCNSRKWVTIFFFLPFILLAIVGGNVMEEYEIEYKNKYVETVLGSNNFLEIVLNKEMFCMYYGNPKTVIQSSSNMSQPMITKFDKFGHVVSKEYGNIKNIYIWNATEQTVECKGYTNGKYIGATIIYLYEMSNNKYIYEANGTRYEVLFRENGSLYKISANNNGQSMGTTYFYRKKEDKFPYKAIMSAGGQSVTTMFSELHKDSIGNVIRIIQTSLGQSVVNTSDIEYY